MTPETPYGYETVIVRIDERVAHVMLNRPEKRNAMNPLLHREMDDALLHLEHDDRVGVVVLSGAGGNFSAGLDMKEMFRDMEDQPLADASATEASIRWRWQRLANFAKPTIAMVEGYCIGGAFTQLLGCDFAVAANSAQFSLSEVNWGILPGGLVAKVLADALLPRHAVYYACLGESFSAAEAERIGLINYCVEDERLSAEVMNLAHKLLAKSPAVLRATKQAVRNVRTMDIPQALEYLATKSIAMQLGDAEESYSRGLSQFLDEKRYKPAHEPFKLRDTD